MVVSPPKPDGRSLRRLTTEEFVARAKRIHGDRYDYTCTDYKPNDCKLYIRCKVHGIFKQAPSKHLKGSGCSRCAHESYSKNKTRSLEVFVSKAKEVHGNKYDYTHVVYKGCRVKIRICCSIHGIFEQFPARHLTGSGCKQCAIDTLRISQKTFLERALEIHGTKYDYAKTHYVDFHSKIVITCPIHGDFTTRPSTHIGNKSGCAKCGYLATGSALTDSVEEFLRKAKNTHGEFYDYQLSADDFINAHKPVRIICRLHGIFTQIPSAHIAGRGCIRCGDISAGKHSTTPFETVLEKCKRKHGEKYMYLTQPDEYTNTRTKLRIQCPKHGVFEQTAKDHMRRRGCPACSSSRGEEKIALWLQSHNLDFSRERRFLDCRDKRQLPFDFCVVCNDKIYLIEYHGEQHYFPVRFPGVSQKKAETNFLSSQRRDGIKYNYAMNNQIPLLIIPYQDFSNIETLLEQFLLGTK